MKKHLLLIISVLLISIQVRANHVMGAEITYKAVSNLKFEVTLKIYRDCRGIPMGNPGSFFIRCTSSGSSRSISYLKTSIRDITPRCDTATVPVCNPQNTQVIAEGIEEHTFKGIVDFNVSPLSTDLANGCCDFVIYYEECCRNGAVNTGSAGTFYVDSKIDVCKAPMNSSPQFTVDPVIFLCCHQPFYYNMSAADSADADSLAYELVAAKESSGTNFMYNTGYSPAKPLTPYLPGSPDQILPTANPPIGFYLDPVKGDLVFTPTNCSEVGPVAVAVSEYRKDSSGTYRKIGEIVRDLQFIVRNCPGNNPPTVAGVSGSSYYICEGTQLCFNIISKDQQFIVPPPATSAPPDSIKLNWNAGISGASFTIDSFTTITPGPNGAVSQRNARFCWTPAPGKARAVPYTFSVIAEDNSCNPRPAKTIRSFSVQVKKRIDINRNYQVLPCGKLKVIASSSDSIINPLWTIRDSANKVISKAHVNKTSSKSVNDSFQFNIQGKYLVFFWGTNSANCSVIYVDTIEVNSGFTAFIDTAFTDTTLVCYGSPVTLNSIVNAAQPPWKYKWISAPPAGGNDSSASYTVKPLDGMNIQLQVTDSSGCTVGNQVFLRGSGKFSLGPDLTGCKGLINTINGPGAMNSYLWLPDSVTSQNISPSKPGTYILQTVNSMNCAYADTINFDLDSIPPFSFNTNSLGAKFFSFIPSIIDTAYKYLWDFGDSISSASVNPVHIFGDTGTYKVCLYLSTAGGCTDTFCASVKAYAVNQFKTTVPVNIYPNPFTEHIELSFFLSSNSQVSCALYDMPGREVYSEGYEIVPAGEYKKTIDLSSRQLEKGVYTLKLDINGQELYLRVLKY